MIDSRRKKFKKVMKYIAWSFLTIGVSLLLGFLSFGGMFAFLSAGTMLALWPILSTSLVAFGLSVAYEAEVYFQNIKGAWNKLFKRNYIKQTIAKDYLLDKITNLDLENDPECPQFFKDYAAQYLLVKRYGEKRLTNKDTADKKRAKSILADMEEWFALQLFAEKSIQATSDYEIALQNWLEKNQQEECHAKLSKHRLSFNLAKVFSVLSGLFMGFGTTYLLVEAFTTLPFFAVLPIMAWPVIIVPLAAIAGAAYAFLTYNAITDMINNDTVRKWWKKFRGYFTEPVSTANVFMAITSIILVILAIGLTICTAGTWWTIAKYAQPLFSWMAKIPSFVMGVLNPLITGLSALAFNLQNTSESLELINEEVQKEGNFFSRLFTKVKVAFQELRQHENWLQIFNPFRLLLKITVAPLRIILFLGHLLSIGVTADRMPGLPEVLSGLLGIISEGFEDWHYFFGHDHDHDHEHEHEHEHEEHENAHSGCSAHHQHPENLNEQEHCNGLVHESAYPHDGENDIVHAPHPAPSLTRLKTLLTHHPETAEGHNHNQDFPTLVLKIIFFPLYLLAACWDYFTSKLNTDERKPLGFRDAFDKQFGIQMAPPITPPTPEELPSSEWKKTNVLYRLQNFKETHLKETSHDQVTSELKIAALNKLEEEVTAIEASNEYTIKNRLNDEKLNTIYSRHRFKFSSEETVSSSFINELPEQIYAGLG